MSKRERGGRLIPEALYRRGQKRMPTTVEEWRGKYDGVITSVQRLNRELTTLQEAIETREEIIGEVVEALEEEGITFINEAPAAITILRQRLERVKRQAVMECRKHERTRKELERLEWENMHLRCNPDNRDFTEILDKVTDLHKEKERLKGTIALLENVTMPAIEYAVNLPISTAARIHKYQTELVMAVLKFKKDFVALSDREGETGLPTNKIMKQVLRIWYGVLH